jgi:hypothetical protein
MTERFVSIFRRSDSPAARGKFLSRVFGIFSEEIVRLWASDDRAAYEDLGRPTLRQAGERRGSTLDFTLRSRETGKVYVAEMKCEIEYQNYKYLVLSDVPQLRHHRKAAFWALLDVARGGTDFAVRLNGVERKVDGAILIWGAATEEGRRAVVQATGVHDVLTMGEIIADLNAWHCPRYRELLSRRREWVNDMFHQLCEP